MPEADEDDARLYGSDEPGSNPGAAWLLVLAGIIGLAALVPSGGNTAAKRSRSCGAAALLGVLVGLYLALQLFPNQHLIQVGIGCTNSLLAVDILICSGWFSLTGMLASACLSHCLVLDRTLLQLLHWSMFLAVAQLLLACFQSWLASASYCALHSLHSQQQLSNGNGQTVYLVHWSAAIRQASSHAHVFILPKHTLTVVLMICRQ